MEHIDRDKAQRVWQRVQSRQPMPPAVHTPSLPLTPEGLVLEELTDSLLFAQLARQLKDPLAAQFRLLAQQSQNRAGVLRGICILSGLTAPAQIPKPPRQDNISAALRRLLGRLLRRKNEYSRLCDHEEYGPLYERLAVLTVDSALALAGIIGK